MNEIKKLTSEKFSDEEYIKLASLIDEKNKYMCDLIIDDSKLKLQFFKFNSKNGEYDFLTEEIKAFDLSTENNLFLSMKYYLEVFVENEINYEIDFKI